MPNPSALPAQFVGREDYIQRFVSRLEHFRFFVYSGISGIGKTSLLLRLAQEAQRSGLRSAQYLPVYPGETVASLLTRLECRLLGRARLDRPSAADPYARLIDLLTSHGTVLMLDGLHNLRREDLPALVRLFGRHRGGSYRVLGALRGELEVSAVDRSSVHMERLRALNVGEVEQLMGSTTMSPELRARALADANRGGALAHPLTCRYVLALGQGELPEQDFLSSQSARSEHAFRSFMPYLLPRMPRELQDLLGTLTRIGMPLERRLIGDALSRGIEPLIAQGLVNTIDGHVYVHQLVGLYFNQGAALVGDAARQVATALQSYAHTTGEPVAAVRAAEVLAAAGFTVEAVDSLAQSWSWARDPGFMEAYLKTLATIPSDDVLAPRLRLLSAQARVRQGNPATSLPDLERLGATPDDWTRRRALVALAHTQSQLRAYNKVIEAFEALRLTEPPADDLLSVGTLAADAMVRGDQLQAAEALIITLLRDVGERHGFEASLRRLLARVMAQSGRMGEAVQEARLAAAAYEKVGDVYHVATTFGFVGDLYRESGEFELAREAFHQFFTVATAAGDPSLMHLAELATAWVALDIGDVAEATKTVQRVTKELGPAPSRRLRRYLAAAQAMVEVGRGQHERAAQLLLQVVEQWEAAGQRTLVGGLRAQMIRSLIACDRLDAAADAIARSLQNLDPVTNGARVASLLRESALLRLRRGEVPQAMDELNRARQLFARGGNRREEALTLHRIAHAALDEGNAALAQEKAAEALALATEIGHERAIALAQELQARLAMLEDRPKDALVDARAAVQTLRRLGDELGTLHVSESIMHITLRLGDLSRCLRLGRALRDHAAIAQVQEVRVRAIALNGIALMRQNRLDAARSCFRALPNRSFSPATRALMARFGEALALAQGNLKEALRRRSRWVAALLQIPIGRRVVVVRTLGQLALAPRDRCLWRQGANSTWLDTEDVALIDPQSLDLMVDGLQRRVFDAGAVANLTAPLVKLAFRAALVAPKVLPYEAVATALGRSLEEVTVAGKGKALARELHRGLAASPHLVLQVGPTGIRLVPPERWGVLVPVWAAFELSEPQRVVLRYLRRVGSASLPAVQDQCHLGRNAARKVLDELLAIKLVELVRESRSQAYRLA